MKIQLTGNLLIRNEDYFSWLFVGLIFPTIGLLGLFEIISFGNPKNNISNSLILFCISCVVLIYIIYALNFVNKITKIKRIDNKLLNEAIINIGYTIIKNSKDIILGVKTSKFGWRKEIIIIHGEESDFINIKTYNFFNNFVSLFHIISETAERNKIMKITNQTPNP